MQTTCGAPRAQQTESTALHSRRSGSLQLLRRPLHLRDRPSIWSITAINIALPRQQLKTSRQAGQHPTALRDPSVNIPIPQSLMQKTARPPETPISFHPLYHHPPIFILLDQLVSIPLQTSLPPWGIKCSPESPHHNGLPGLPSEVGRTWTGL